MATPGEEPRSIQVVGGITDKPKRVHRRRYDNLPDRVKGSLEFYTFKDHQDRFTPQTGYYTNDEQRRVAVELLEDPQGEDAWYILDQDTTGRYAVNRHNKLDLYARGTGYWYIDDHQHPDYQPDEPEEAVTAAPHEEFLAGGLHHVATLEGPQAQLSPTHLVLSIIEQAAIQGKQIPTNIQPIASTSQVIIQPPAPPAAMAQAGQAQIAMQIVPPPAQQAQAQPQVQQPAQQAQQPAQQQAQGQAPAAPQGNGALKGSAPPVFKGEHTESHKFLMAFRTFCVANRNNETLINPVTRIATALTYMDGPLVDPWKEDQLNKLEARILAGTPETSEDHWVAFINDFEAAFGNINERQDSWAQLIKLKHGDDLDLFIITFKRLAGKAGANLDDLGTTELFKYGLKEGLAKEIMQMPTYNPRIAWTFQQWEDAAKDCHMKWLHQREFSNRSNRLRHGLHRALNIQGQKNNNQQGGRRTTSQGGDAMDIDAMRGPELSPEKKDELMKANACFYCTKPGHCAKDCHKKARDRANKQGNTSTNYQPCSQAKAAAPDMNADDITTFLKENVETIDEETKMSIVEKLLPSGFLQALN